MPDFLTPDLCIIGGGAAGVAAARAASRYGARIVLVEQDRLGGAALNTAALPSMALAAAGRRAQYLRSAGPFGIAAEEPKISARGVFDHVHEIIGRGGATLTPEQLARVKELREEAKAKMKAKPAANAGAAKQEAGN